MGCNGSQQGEAGVAARKVLRKAAIGGTTSVNDKEESVKRVFREWDGNGNGAISAPELVAVLQKLGVELPNKTVELLFKECDSNKDGVLDYEEFCSWLFEAPGFAEYFEKLQSIQKSTEKQVSEIMQAWEVECSKPKARQRVIGPNMEIVRASTQQTYVEALTPIIQKTFRWYVKDDSNTLAKDDSILFFSNFVERLQSSLTVSVASSCRQQLRLEGPLDMRQLAIVFWSVPEKIQEKMRDYRKNIDLRQKTAFDVIDRSRDGSLQENEVVEALMPGTLRNVELMDALGILITVEEICEDLFVGLRKDTSSKQVEPYDFDADEAATPLSARPTRDSIGSDWICVSARQHGEVISLQRETSEASVKFNDGTIETFAIDDLRSSTSTELSLGGTVAAKVQREGKLLRVLSRSPSTSVSLRLGTGSETWLELDETPPAVKLQLRLVTIKWHLKGMEKRGESLTDEQQRAIVRVVYMDEDVETNCAEFSCRGAVNALISMFGVFQADDQSPETLERLRVLSANLDHVAQAFGLPDDD